MLSRRAKEQPTRETRVSEPKPPLTCCTALVLVPGCRGYVHYMRMLSRRRDER
jgi:hypothetical protein